MNGFWDRLRVRFWVIPLICAVLATALGLGLTALDDRLDTSFSIPFLFDGGPEGARSVLSAIITSMISFTGLVFSITIVVLQLTSSQFSPRVLRTFLRDWVNQIALGVFVATFIYALVILRAVRGTSQVAPFVPQLSVTVAFGFVLASVVVFLIYINHIAQSIRAITIITRIADDTRSLLDRRFPAEADFIAPMPLPAVGRRHIIEANHPGVVQQIDDDALLDLANKHSVTVCLLRAVGEFVPSGAALLEIYGEDPPENRLFLAAVRLGRERTNLEDVGFGLRQLVDIAERALSPGINDPTTAVQVIDQLHDLLRRLATRTLQPRQAAEDGRLVVHVPQPDFVDYLSLAIDEIAHWGSDSKRVQYRLRVMLDDLHDAALPQYVSAISRALDSLERDRSVPIESRPLAPSDLGLR